MKERQLQAIADTMVNSGHFSGVLIDYTRPDPSTHRAIFASAYDDWMDNKTTRDTLTAAAQILTSALAVGESGVAIRTSTNRVILAEHIPLDNKDSVLVTGLAPTSAGRKSARRTMRRILRKIGTANEQPASP